jgi:Zn-dependent metalloprotease
MPAGRVLPLAAFAAALLGGALSGVVQAAGTSETAADRAKAFGKSHASALKASRADRFEVRDVIVDADGTEHVRMARRHGDLPVIGGDVVVHSRGGRLKSVSLTQAAPIRLDAGRMLDASEAIVAAGAEFGGAFVGMPTALQVVYARGRGAARLAWKISFEGSDAQGGPLAMTYVVDARNGRLLDRWSDLHTISRGKSEIACLQVKASPGQGHTLYSGDVTIATEQCNGRYQMRDPQRGGSTTVDMRNRETTGTVFVDADNIWGRNSNSDRDSAGADAHYGLAATWDYFKFVHGRLGVDGLGTPVTSRVHYGRNYANAFWSDACFCMTYGGGDGNLVGPLVNLDIAAHEMSHGVTSRSANLIYSGESGALNEATSDIFATMVEFRANNATDVADWTIGEEMYLHGGRALRYMYKPSLDGRSLDCWDPSLANRDVHHGSGVANRFFYLLSEGASTPAGTALAPSQLVCNGNVALRGLGREMAEKIWYRALTVYFTSGTDYAGARRATRDAALDLYGPDVAARVLAAWSAAGVN